MCAAGDEVGVDWHAQGSASPPPPGATNVGLRATSANVLKPPPTAGRPRAWRRNFALYLLCLAQENTRDSRLALLPATTTMPCRKAGSIRRPSTPTITFSLSCKKIMQPWIWWVSSSMCVYAMPVRRVPGDLYLYGSTLLLLRGGVPQANDIVACHVRRLSHLSPATRHYLL